VSWEFKPEFDAGHRAALSTGRNLVYVAPPAWWAIIPLIKQLPPAPAPGLQTVVVVPRAMGVAEGAAALRAVQSSTPIHAATGLARTGRKLAESQIATLVVTATDLLELVSRSRAALDRIARIVIGWPELMFQLHEGDQLDTILAESAKAQRLFATTNETQIGDFVERHARRALLLPAAPMPEAASVTVRYAVTDWAGVARTVRSVLDVVDPASAVIWNPAELAGEDWDEYSDDTIVHLLSAEMIDQADLAIAAELPSCAVLDMLSGLSRNIVALVRPAQLPYLKAVTRMARVLRLPGDVDRARDRYGRLRQEIRHAIAEGQGAAELLALAPLFDDHDPASVAAALAARAATPEEHPVTGGPQAWVRIRVSGGQRARIRTGDLVGALLNAVGLARTQIGRVEIRDSHSLVEVRAEVAETARQQLDGLVVRGKQLAARFDRR
jgi:hypothetical protein